MNTSARWALAVAWGCVWSLAWLHGTGAWCFAVGWAPAWGLALAVLLSPHRLG